VQRSTQSEKRNVREGTNTDAEDVKETPVSFSSDNWSDFLRPGRKKILRSVTDQFPEQ
jgi:hypothetical protein